MKQEFKVTTLRKKKLLVEHRKAWNFSRDPGNEGDVNKAMTSLIRKLYGILSLYLIS